METKEKAKENKVPDVIIDPSLDKYNNVVLFPESVRKAKETIDRISLPEDEKQNHL